MYKIAVMGDLDSILGFKVLGLDVFAFTDPQEAAKKLGALARDDYAVIYVTEQLAKSIKTEIDRYKNAETPAVILIPGKDGSLGIGRAAVKEYVEKAVGADIFADK